jgi:polysaccharide pyruvyl transferase CsaB
VGDIEMAEKTTTQTQKPYRVVLAGYYGFGNLGDEVLLNVMLRWLKQFPNVEPCVLSGNPDQTRKFFGVNAVPRIGITAFLKAFLGAKALIFGGGSILQDVTSRRSLLYYTGLIQMARALGIPVMMMGQGIGPLSERSRARVAAVLKHVDYISVRDQASFDMLQRWGIKNAYLGADLAFSLTPPPLPRETARPVLGLALVVPPEQHYESVLNRIAKAVTAVCDTFELTPIFLASNRQDLRFGVALNQRLPELTVLPVSQDSPEHHLAMLGEFNVIWTSRMHALVLSAVAGVPFIGLSYDPKVDYIVDQLNEHLIQPMENWPLNQVEPKELVKTTSTLLKGYHDTGRNLRQAAAIKQAEAQAALIDAGHHLSDLLALQDAASSTTVKSSS